MNTTSTFTNDKPLITARGRDQSAAGVAIGLLLFGLVILFIKLSGLQLPDLDDVLSDAIGEIVTAVVFGIGMYIVNRLIKIKYAFFDDVWVRTRGFKSSAFSYDVITAVAYDNCNRAMLFTVSTGNGIDKRLKIRQPEPAMGLNLSLYTLLIQKRPRLLPELKAFNLPFEPENVPVRFERNQIHLLHRDGRIKESLDMADITDIELVVKRDADNNPGSYNAKLHLKRANSKTRKVSISKYPEPTDHLLSELCRLYNLPD